MKGATEMKGKSRLFVIGDAVDEAVDVDRVDWTARGDQGSAHDRFDDFVPTLGR
jgi:hypothetical protein